MCDRNCLPCLCKSVLCLNEKIKQLEEKINQCCDDKYKPWSSNKKYNVGDIVKKGNELYQCIKAHTSTGQNKPPDAEYWTLYNG